MNKAFIQIPIILGVAGVLALGAIAFNSFKVGTNSVTQQILGAIGIGWNATSTTQGWISPNRVNGVEQAPRATYFVASSTTATSTFLGGLDVGNNAGFSVSAGAPAGSLKVTTAGNVGIGTTAPLSKLAVSGGVSIGANYNTAAPTNGLIVEGVVGIGASTAPTKTLDVTGSIGSTGGVFADTFNSKSTGTLEFGYTNASDFQFCATASCATTAMMIKTTTGNVGIGETAPGAKLSVSGGLAVGSGYDTTVVGDGNMIISGNVGIGTTTPTSLLQVAGATPKITLSDTSGATNGKHWFLGNASGDFSVGTTSDSLATNLTYLTVKGSTGYIGIGTTGPSAKLDITKTVSAYNSLIQLSDIGTNLDTKTGIDWANTQYGWSQARINTERQGSSANFDLVFSSATAGVLNEGMRIDNLGNVGIGTTTPNANLQVDSASATSTAAITSHSGNKGGRLILTDINGTTCTEVTSLAGVLTAKAVTCP